MKCFIGLGSNQGDRKQTLEFAIQKLNLISTNGKIIISPIYESSALIPIGAPKEWGEASYLNAVIQIEWSLSSMELLLELKQIEKDLGRITAPRWAPRIIDLDLLTFGDEVIDSENLKIPHPEILHRSFVLDPLKDLASTYQLPRTQKSVCVLARRLKSHTPLIMGILNLTPDSFSDGGVNLVTQNLESNLNKMLELEIPIVDLGAESTRPGAKMISIQEEWRRLEPALQYTHQFFKNKSFRPIISIDTSKPEIAERALSMGVTMINDVSGLAHLKMRGLVKESGCDFIFMHSLTQPANPDVCWSKTVDPIQELKIWIEEKMKLFEKEGLDLDRAIFDPGIGFGKTALQSIAILRRLDEFSELPVRILIGHSRKSFIKAWNISSPQLRDSATLSVSLAIKNKGIDILRVHDFESHKIALQSFQEIL